MSHEHSNVQEQGQKKLKALVVADCLQNHFEPLDNDQSPQCLFPLANIPHLQYIMEFLLMNQVYDIIIASKTSNQHRQKVEEFAKSMRSKLFKIKVVGITGDAKNLGDVLRQVVEMKVLKDDFILVKGDIITNIDLHEAIKMHYNVKQQEAQKENQSTDVRKYKTIATKIFIKMSHSNPLRDPQTDITLLMDGQTKEILKYQSNYQDKKQQLKSITLNDEHLQSAFTKSFAEQKNQDRKEKNQQDKFVKVNNIYPGSSSLEIRQDLLDCELAICTVDLLDHFTDNFDKANLKDGFINWMQESEIIEDRIRAFEVSEQSAYFARIFNPRIFGIVNQDIIKRKVYPLVIDKKAMDPNSNYVTKMLNTYIDKSARISMTANISNNVVIGSQTVIDGNALIKNSIVGQNCKIQQNVQIIDSVIDKNVIIEEGCFIHKAIILAGTHVKQNVKITGGTMVSENILIKQNVTIPEQSFCSFYNYAPQEKKFKEINILKENNIEFFEKGTISYIPRDLQLKESEFIGSQQANDYEIESDLDEDIEEDEKDPKEEFTQEVEDLFQDSYETQQQQPIPNEVFVKNLVSEIKSCKLTFNVQNNTVIETILPLILDIVLQQKDPKALLNQKELSLKIVQVITQYQALIKEFCTNGQEEETYLIEETEIFCGRDKQQYFGKLFHVVIQCFWKQQIVSSSVILSWMEKSRKTLTVYKKDPKFDSKDNSLVAPDDIDSEDIDEILEIVGIEQREKFLESMKKFEEYLEDLEDKKSDSDDSSSESDDSNKKQTKQVAKKQIKKNKSSSSSEESDSEDKKKKKQASSSSSSSS